MWKVITESEQLVAWAEENDILFKLSKPEAGMLLRYLAGYGYGMEMDEQKQLHRVNLEDCSENTEESISLDEVIDTICEWNYELVYDARRSFAKAESILEQNTHLKLIQDLVKDEKLLDLLYGKTRYGKQYLPIIETTTYQAPTEQDKRQMEGRGQRR